MPPQLPIHILLFGNSPSIGALLQSALTPKYTLTQFTTLPQIQDELKHRHALYDGLLVGGGIDGESRQAVRKEAETVNVKVVELPQGFARDVGMENLGVKTGKVLEGVFGGREE
ncbi:hypothetical protein HDV00_007356 [Rhizophlyctis rosea]|nr:hypothetical protein HDV00_007356 [Rhizophlyctis rosea]